MDSLLMVPWIALEGELAEVGLKIWESVVFGPILAAGVS